MDNPAPISEENGVPQPSLLEAILDRDNLECAWKRVRANKGKPGMDGMTVAEFPAFSRANMPRDKSKVAPLGECDFLGFNIRGKRIRRTEKAARRFKLRIQDEAKRRWIAERRPGGWRSHQIYRRALSFVKRPSMHFRNSQARRYR